MKTAEYRPGLRVCKRLQPNFKKRSGVTLSDEVFYREGVAVPYCMVRWDNSAMPESMSVHALCIIITEPQSQGGIAS